ncbi:MULTISPECIES: hypothetical protein [Serratia]|jgi:hypothetical protein|uniref:hypothetical protein n=1 Tax=Serratia TaxID=613 RepID=UPI000930AC6A|nr:MULTISPECIES: hypothetical protein [Serratia]WIF05648.1 hypothetical protein QEP77_17215 [Serratia sp. B1]MBH2623763.1 hypothetical protein [Serratia marcescens]OPJ96490.1 hypothetical protein B1R44_10890 [Serratia marcescens]PYA07295.1 hypothetical protein DMW43_08120 [Serratia marcescens]QDI12534.1 helix-turn-helix domain-containing protein [Serratia marcescens]
MNEVKKAIKAVGGPARAAEICDRSVTAIQKWQSKGCLPRTEYTGKTKYAEILASHSNGEVIASELLEKANPDRVSC